METQTYNAPLGTVISHVDYDEKKVVVLFEEAPDYFEIPDINFIDEDIKKRADAFAMLMQLQENLGKPNIGDRCYYIFGTTNIGITPGTYFTGSTSPAFRTKKIAEAVLYKYSETFKIYFNDAN